MPQYRRLTGGVQDVCIVSGAARRACWREFWREKYMGPGWLPPSQEVWQ